MSDPVSLTASVIAITTFTVHISALVRTAIHASDEIIALRDELGDVGSLAKLLQTLSQRHWPREQQANIDAAKRVLHEIVKTRLPKIQGYLDKLEQHKSKTIQHFRYVALRGKINGERQGLHGAKQHLFDVICILNASTTRDLSQNIESISRSVTLVHDTQIQNHHDTVARLDQYFGPVQNMYMQDYRNLMTRFDLYFGPAQSTDVQTHRDVLTRFNQYLDRIQTVHMQDYQGVLGRFEQCLGPVEKRRLHNHRDIVACFDQYLDRIQRRQMLLQRWSSYLTAGLYRFQIAVSGVATNPVSTSTHQSTSHVSRPCACPCHRERKFWDSSHSTDLGSKIMRLDCGPPWTRLSRDLYNWKQTLCSLITCHWFPASRHPQACVIAVGSITWIRRRPLHQ